MNCVCAADDQAELHHTVFLSAHRSCCWMCMQLQTTHRYHMLDLLYRKKNRNDHSELICVWWSWLKWRHGEAGGIFCTSSTKFVGVICIISTFDADSTCVWSDCQVGRDDRKARRLVKHRKYICWFCWWAFWWDYRPTGTFTPDQEPFVHNQAKLRRKMWFVYNQTKLD